jgi:hypothetical protein
MMIPETRSTPHREGRSLNEVGVGAMQSDGGKSPDHGGKILKDGR